ncbi:MAG: alpha/beta fold hydrolase [Rhizobiaceae bacterium]
MTSLPLVLVHGFMGGSDQWALQRTALGNDYDLVTVDLPGFGRNNELQAPDTINGFANFVLDFLTDNSISNFRLLGHSMGGMIVQEMIAIAPERIKQLILYGTAATGNLPDRFETFETSRQRVMADGVADSARRISATWFLEYEGAAEFENCANLAQQSSLQAMLAALNAMEVWSRKDKLQNISCPTMIVWGEKDRTYHWPQIEELWNTIPGASLAVVPGCSHAAHMEKPRIFNAIVSDFLLC